jgi:hypothetical protein
MRNLSILIILLFTVGCTGSDGPSDDLVRDVVESGHGGLFTVGDIETNKTTDINDTTLELIITTGLEVNRNPQNQNEAMTLGSFREGDTFNRDLRLTFEKTEGQQWSLVEMKRCCAQDNAPSDADIQRAFDDSAPNFMATTDWERVNEFPLEDGGYVVELKARTEYTKSYAQIRQQLLKVPTGRAILSTIRSQHGAFAKGESWVSTASVAFKETSDGWIAVQ